jgi:hypothetical protein
VSALARHGGSGSRCAASCAAAVLDKAINVTKTIRCMANDTP